MISTISQNASFLNLSVGLEVRVLDSRKTGDDVESFRVKKEKDAQRKEPPKFEESQNLKSASEQVEESVAGLQATLQHVEPRIELSVDKELNRVIVRVVEKESGELVRQIPSEEILELNRFFADQSRLLVEENI